jgi:hypothetical protein
MATAAILALAAHRGCVETVPGTTAPPLRGSFGLEESELASIMESPAGASPVLAPGLGAPSAETGPAALRTAGRSIGIVLPTPHAPVDLAAA